jgi:hypothetical protein
MDWIHTDPASLSGTAYFEIVPGPYVQLHWQPGSLFLDEERFGYIEPIIAKHVPDYDHYAMVEVPREAWVPILTELSELEEALQSTNEFSKVRSRIGFFFERSEETFLSELESNVTKLRIMIGELRSWLSETLESHEVVSVLGL